jgi:hypothetical protein
VPEERVRPRGLGEADGRARRGAVADQLHEVLQAVLRRIARSQHEVDDVPLDLGIHVDHLGRVARPHDLGGRHDRLHIGDLARRHPPHDLQLLGVRRVVDRELQHEAVDLRLRERIRAFLLDRVLRGEHQEGIVERIGMLADGDRVLLHGLEQRRLHLGRRAVDLIGQDDVREDRAALGLELLILGIVDERADQVRGQEVRGELDAPERRVDRPGERAHGERLGEAGHALHEHVAVGEQADEQALDHRLLTHDDVADLDQEPLHERALLADLLLDDLDVEALGRCLCGLHGRVW